MSVAEAKYVEVLRTALGASGGKRTHFTASDVVLAGLAVSHLKSGVVDVVEEAILALVAGLVVGAGAAAGKSVVAEEVDDEGFGGDDGFGGVVAVGASIDAVDGVEVDGAVLGGGEHEPIAAYIVASEVI